MLQLKSKIRDMLALLEMHQITLTWRVIEDLNRVMGKLNDLDREERELKAQSIRKLREEYFLLKRTRPFMNRDEWELKVRIEELKRLNEVKDVDAKKNRWQDRNIGRVVVIKREVSAPDLVINIKEWPLENEKKELNQNDSDEFKSFKNERKPNNVAEKRKNSRFRSKAKSKQKEGIQ